MYPAKLVRASEDRAAVFGGEEAVKKKTTRKAASSKPTAKAEPISKRDLGPIKKKLIEMRDRLHATVKQKQELDLDTSNEVGDEADQATSSQEKEMLFELNDNERAMLDQIEGSLRKMEKGAYGLCESCQKPIAKLRLEAVPFARYCIACQSSAENAVLS